MEKWKNRVPLLVLLLAVCSTLFFNSSHFNELPTHRHAWSQFDHHAISIGFVDNGLDFFHPQTDTKILYPWSEPQEKQSFSYVTSVDFPVHHYIPAISMKVWGNTAPIHNRLYTYIYSLLGVFFLHKLSKLLIEDEYLAIIPPLLLIFSPIFVYYQIGILPSIPSLVNLIIGTCFFLANGIAVCRSQLLLFGFIYVSYFIFDNRFIVFNSFASMVIKDWNCFGSCRFR